MSDTGQLDAILRHLQVTRGPSGKGEYVAWCPFHRDGKGMPPHEANLSVSERGFYCHACGAKGGLKKLAQKLGVDVGGGNGKGVSHRVCATYPYRDEKGNLLFEVIRTEPKGFFQRRPDGKGGWITNLNGTRRVLYRLPELLANTEAPVWIVEGEKDVDRLTKDGLVATTNPGGAGKWRAECGEFLRGRDIVIIPDDDDPGERHAQAVAESLAGVVSSMKILRLAGLPPKGDVSDWLDAGHSTQELPTLAEAALPFDVTALSQHEKRESDVLAVAVVESPDDPHRLARIYLNQKRAGPNRTVTVRFWRHQLWRWDGCRYSVLDTDELRAELANAVKAELDRWTVAHNADAPVRKVSQQLVANVLQALNGMVVVPGHIEQPAWLGTPGQNRRYLSLANGLLDLDGWLAGNPCQLLPHTPEWFSPVHLPFVFDDDAECPQWLEFLKEVLEKDCERIHLLQEWFGYCLTPDTTLQKFLVLEGEGANGKSVVCEVLTGLLGTENVSHVPLELFGQRFQLAKTLGRLANIASEVGELDKAAEGILKAFTAGDRMYFDRKGISGIEAYPTARLVLATNNRPRFSDRTSGLWRRMLLLPFRVSIPEARQDHHLAAKLKRELPGVFCWAVAGLYRLRQARCFTLPQCCHEALEEYRNESNPARLFLADACTEALGAFVACVELYKAYRKWCDDNGYHALGERMFGKEVVRVFPRVERARRGSGEHREYRYEGLQCPMCPMNPMSSYPSP